MDTINALLQEWLEEASQLRKRYANESAARVCEAHVRELKAALESKADELVTVTEAAAETGYSKQHLRALLASGDIQNAGRKGRPRIRRRDLPPRKAEASRAEGPPEKGKGTSGAQRATRNFDAHRLVRG